MVLDVSPDRDRIGQGPEGSHLSDQDYYWGRIMTTFQSDVLSKSPHSAVRAATVAAARSKSHAGSNVGETERWISGAAGAALVAHGLKKGSLGGLVLAGLGGGLLFRAATGHCGLYDRLGVSTADRRRVAFKGFGDVHRGILVKKSVTVSRPIEEVYRYWRDFANFPKFMQHLEEVQAMDPRHSHWVARGPMGKSVEWDAEIFNERPNELIAWRSLPGSQVDHAGSVRFRKAPADRGTEVHVELNYESPGGRLGAAIAWLFGEEPRIQMEDDLLRFKQVMEAGEIATVDGQPKGR
jgi:uncharacterized membrane protein